MNLRPDVRLRTNGRGWMVEIWVTRRRVPWVWRRTGGWVSVNVDGFAHVTNDEHLARAIYRELSGENPWRTVESTLDGDRG